MVVKVNAVQDVNWARAGLGLALLEEAVERKPGAVPVGQYISPSHTSVTTLQTKDQKSNAYVNYADSQESGFFNIPDPGKIPI